MEVNPLKGMNPASNRVTPGVTDRLLTPSGLNLAITAKLARYVGESLSQQK